MATLPNSPRIGGASALSAVEAVLRDEGGGLGASLEVELREDRADVVLDGLVRQEDVGRDLLVRLALGDEQQDLLLLGGQRRELVRVGPSRDPADALEDLL